MKRIKFLFIILSLLFNYNLFGQDKVFYLYIYLKPSVNIAINDYSDIAKNFRVNIEDDLRWYDVQYSDFENKFIVNDENEIGLGIPLSKEKIRRINKHKISINVLNYNYSSPYFIPKEKISISIKKILNKNKINLEFKVNQNIIKNKKSNVVIRRITETYPKEMLNVFIKEFKKINQSNNAKFNKKIKIVEKKLISEFKNHFTDDITRLQSSIKDDFKNLKNDFSNDFSSFETDIYKLFNFESIKNEIHKLEERSILADQFFINNWKKQIEHLESQEMLKYYALFSLHIGEFHAAYAYISILEEYSQDLNRLKIIINQYSDLKLNIQKQNYLNSFISALNLKKQINNLDLVIEFKHLYKTNADFSKFIDIKIYETVHNYVDEANEINKTLNNPRKRKKRVLKFISKIGLTEFYKWFLKKEYNDIEDYFCSSISNNIIIDEYRCNDCKSKWTCLNGYLTSVFIYSIRIDSHPSSSYLLQLSKNEMQRLINNAISALNNNKKTYKDLIYGLKEAKRYY